MQLHPTAKTPTEIRRLNRHVILSLLRQYAMLSKSDLVRLTGRTVTTIANILDELSAEDLVDVVDEAEQNPAVEISRGRPASLYSLSSRRWVAGGIQIASNSVTAALVSLTGEVLDWAMVAAPSDLPADEVLTTASDLLRTLIERRMMAEMELLGIGIALEGIVDVAAGVSLWMLFRSGWRDVPVAAHFEKRFGVAVLVDYRVYVAALAEALYGAARGVSDFAYLNVDTGIAVASVASGRMVRSGIGSAGVTGGLGHVLNSGSSRLCYCGKVGCLHNEITTQALVAQLRELVSVSQGNDLGIFWKTHEIRFDNLTDAAQQGDSLALQLRNRFAHSLGIAVSGTAQLFSANLIIIGGAAVHFGGEEALEEARRAVQRLVVLHSQFGLTKVVASDLLPDSATVGAGTLIIQAVMDGQIAVPTRQAP
jgi:predicted NBD/HSP70 family sugar kinase